MASLHLLLFSLPISTSAIKPTTGTSAGATTGSSTEQSFLQWLRVHQQKDERDHIIYISERFQEPRHPNGLYRRREIRLSGVHPRLRRRGTASMAPKARLAVYKVCWKVGYHNADILTAFDVADGVDVVSLRVGCVVVSYCLKAAAIAAFGANDAGVFVSTSAGVFVSTSAGVFVSTSAGVFVSTSAGNGSPYGLTVTNVAPWVTAVGYGTIDRDFLVELKLGNCATLNQLQSRQCVVADCHVLPTVNVGASSANELRKYTSAASKKPTRRTTPPSSSGSPGQ